MKNYLVKSFGNFLGFSCIFFFRKNKQPKPTWCNIFFSKGNYYIIKCILLFIYFFKKIMYLFIYLHAYLCIYSFMYFFYSFMFIFIYFMYVCIYLCTYLFICVHMHLSIFMRYFYLKKAQVHTWFMNKVHYTTSLMDIFSYKNKIFLNKCF